jgi:alpha-mannosidase
MRIRLALLASITAAGALATDVLVVPFSHLDFFWGGTREECLARGNQIIAKAVALAKAHADFRFLIEDNVFVANYQESHQGSTELEDFKRLVKEGRLEIAPKWAAIFQNIPNGEVHVRNFLIGKRYARSVFGVDPQVAHLGDLPGYTPQFPQMAVKSRVPYMVMTRMGPNDKSLFYWKSPDGSKALVWHTIAHYGWGSALGLHLEIDNARKERIRTEVEQIRGTFDGPIFMSWGSDLWAPTVKLIENVRALDNSIPGLRFGFATPMEFFRRVARWTSLPELSGEIPSSWPNVYSSLAHMWPLAVPATNTLLVAERFAALNYGLGYSSYPQAELDFLWQKLIESMDHNHDGQGGKIGDDRKIEYSKMAIIRGGEILRDSLRNIAERIEFAVKPSHPIVVFNPLGWPRDDFVRAHVTLYGPVAPRDLEDYRRGVRLVDETGRPVPFHVEEYSENISRALVVTFLARDVPPLGYRTYYLTPSERPERFPDAAQVNLDAAKDQQDPRRPMEADVMENQFYRISADKPTGRVTIFDKILGRDIVKDAEIVADEERGGNYIGVEPLSGRSIPASVDGVRVEENNAVRTVLRLDVRVADIPIVQRYILYRDAKRVDLENTVEWRRPRFLRLQQLFPYTEREAKIFYGVPFAAQDADGVLPNSEPDKPDEITRESWLASRQILDWIWVGTDVWGLTIAADHQLIKLSPGVIRAEMLRGSRFASVKVVRGEEVTSLFYPPPGSYHFRFSLTSGKGDWRSARSYQAGMSFNSPLLAVSVVDEVSSKSLPPVHSFAALDRDNLVLSALKKAEQGDTLVLRFFEIQGERTETAVQLLGQERPVQEVNLLEEGDGPERSAVSVSPYEIKTVKVRLER